MKPEGGFDDFSLKPPTAVATRAIIVVCVAVQGVATIGGAALRDTLANGGGLIPSRFDALLAGQGDPSTMLTLLTSLFLHAGWIHLGLNMLFLGWIGRAVEISLGWRRFVVLYFAAGIASGALHLVVEAHSPFVVVGASGAIAGVFAVYAMMFSRSRAASRRIAGINLSSALLTSLWFATIWAALQLLTALAFNTGGDQGIAIWSHIGGFVAGLLLVQPLTGRLHHR